jgi:hypothetical protein
MTRNMAKQFVVFAIVAPVRFSDWAQLEESVRAAKGDR